MPIAENLMNLHAEEERIRSLSICQIDSNPALTLQVELLEASMTALLHFSSRWPTVDLNMLTIQHLGIRLCNSAASGFKLLLSGYYQSAAAQIRDLLETGFRSRSEATSTLPYLTFRSFTPIMSD